MIPELGSRLQVGWSAQTPRFSAGTNEVMWVPFLNRTPKWFNLYVARPIVNDKRNMHAPLWDSTHVDGSLMFTFFRIVHFSYDMKHAISARWLATPNCTCSHWYVLEPLSVKCFETHMNISFIIKVKILVLMKWPYRSPPTYVHSWA